MSSVSTYNWLDWVWLVLTNLAVLAALGWVLRAWLRRSEDPGRLLMRWGLTAGLLAGIVFLVMPVVAAGGYVGAFVGVPLTAVFGLLMAIVWAPSISAAFARPFMNLYDGGSTMVDPAPVYSVAESLRKKGLYAEAAAEVKVQLAAFPEDFTGQLLLAEIQAENLHDFPAAQATLEQFLAQPDHATENLAYALNRLADWHLKLVNDPAAARQALERIVERFPEAEPAQRARQRIAHLPAPKPTGPRPPVPVPHHEENLGLREDFTGLKAPVEDPEAQAERLVAKLREHPYEWEAREELASLYAGHYGRLDLATDQLEQLLAQPGQPAKQIVHWLNGLADLYIHFGTDPVPARQALERIIALHPTGAAAEGARNRLARIELEWKAKRKSPVVKLGTYAPLEGRPPGRPGGGPVT